MGLKWDPTRFDSILTSDRTWLQHQPVLPPIHEGFSHNRDYLQRFAASIESTPVVDTVPPPPSAPDYERLRRYFFGIPTAAVQATLEATTQFYQSVGVDTARIIDTHRSPVPGNNVHRHNERLATVPVIPDRTAWGGFTLFLGRSSYHIYVSGMSKESEFPGALEDVIRKYSAPDTLISDMAKPEISQRVKDLLRKFCIDEWNIEPHSQWQIKNYRPSAGFPSESDELQFACRVPHLNLHQITLLL